MASRSGRFLPEELLATRSDALLLLGGAGGFVVGIILMFILPAATGQTLGVIYGVAVGMAGVTALNVVNWRASRRLQPERVGGLRRWWLESQLSQQWLRPSVLRYAVEVAARR
jgi:hypothetical protein